MLTLYFWSTLTLCRVGAEKLEGKDRLSWEHKCVQRDWVAGCREAGHMALPTPHRAPRQQWAEAGCTVRYLLALITQVGGHGLPTRAGEALRERTRKPEP